MGGSDAAVFLPECAIIHPAKKGSGQMSKIGIYGFAAVLAAVIGMDAVIAAEDPPAAKPKSVVLCPECGMVFSLRQIEKAIAPERKTPSSIASSPQSGGMGGETQAVPLFSLGKGGPHRVPREPATRSAWEVTVRYDSGQFGFLTQDHEPEFKVGDRIKMIDGVIEVLGPPAR
jgi:hypothetical protein